MAIAARMLAKRILLDTRFICLISLVLECLPSPRRLTFRFAILVKRSKRQHVVYRFRNSVSTLFTTFLRGRRVGGQINIAPEQGCPPIPCRGRAEHADRPTPDSGGPGRFFNRLVANNLEFRACGTRRNRHQCKHLYEWKHSDPFDTGSKRKIARTGRLPSWLIQ
jgi:hypothetical protein